MWVGITGLPHYLFSMASNETQSTKYMLSGPQFGPEAILGSIPFSVLCSH